MDVTGEDGILTLEGGAPRGFQAGLLRLRLNGEPADPTDSATAGLPAPVVNVARVYAALRNDIAGGTSTAPDFGHAVRLSHLIDDIRTAATSGQTITPTAAWP
jgi:predicted dehydrogenase